MKMPTAIKLHQASGQWRAWIAGQYRYFGKDAAEAVRLYGLFLAQAPPGDITLAQMIAEVQGWANDRYPSSGRWGGTARLFQYAFRWLDLTVQVNVRGMITTAYLPALPAESFTVMHLAAARARMITAGRKRGYINSTVGRIQQAFAVARERGLITREVLADVRSLAPLPVGHRTVAPSVKVGPAPVAIVEAILPHLSPTMRAIVTTLRHTAKLRVGECVAMRVGAIDDSRELWLYDLQFDHKARNTGKRKVVPLGPLAQKAMAPFVQAARAKMATTAPVWPALSIRNTTDHVSVSSVRDAIELACIAAGKEQITTHQLRHARATELAGLEAQIISRVQQSIGHDSPSSTRIYAELTAIEIEHARLSG